MDNLLSGLVNWEDNWLYYPSRASTRAPSVFGFSPAHSFPFRVPRASAGARHCPPPPADHFLPPLPTSASIPFPHRPLALKFFFCEHIPPAFHSLFSSFSYAPFVNKIYYISKINIDYKKKGRRRAFK